MTKAWFNENGARRVEITNGDVSGAQSKVVIVDPTTGSQVQFTTEVGRHAPIQLASGEKYTIELSPAARTTGAGVAGRIDFVPFTPARNITLSAISLEVTTLLNPSAARLAIWSNVNGNPGVTLAGGTTELDCSTVGEKTQNVSITLKKGETYWISIHTSSTPTYRHVGANSLMQISGAAVGQTTSGNTVRRGTATYASGHPTVAPSTTLAANVTVPVVWLTQA